MKAKCFLLLCCILALSSQIQAGELPAGKEMLWKQPASAPQALDLFWGSGGEARKPVGPFIFEKEDFYGTKPKVWVVDQRGIRWGVKFGGEAQAEVTASRFLWAAGYRTNDIYFVPEGIIQGATTLKRARKFIDEQSGRFNDARFQRDHTGADAAKVENHFISWHWDKNPFVGTRELSGLLFVNVLIANYDTRLGNNRVQTVTSPDGQVENWYMTSDLGCSFGNSHYSDMSRWNLKDYSEEPFIVAHSSESLTLSFYGREAVQFRSIPLEHARWIAGVIGSLTRPQIEDAFRAAISDVRASPLPDPQDEALVKGFADAVEHRLAELRQAVQSP